MFAHVITHHIVGDVLIVAAGDQQNFFFKAAQAGNGTAGRGCDGIIVELHAVFDPYQLDPVLHAAEGGCHAANGLILHQAFHRQDGGHVVFHIMLTGQQDGLLIQHRDTVPAEHIPIQADTVVGFAQAGKIAGCAVTLQGSR